MEENGVQWGDERGATLTVSQVDLSVGGHVTTAEAGGAPDGEAPLMRGCWGSSEEVDALLLKRKTLFIEVH